MDKKEKLMQVIESLCKQAEQNNELRTKLFEGNVNEFIALLQENGIHDISEKNANEILQIIQDKNGELDDDELEQITGGSVATNLVTTIAQKAVPQICEYIQKSF